MSNMNRIRSWKEEKWNLKIELFIFVSMKNHKIYLYNINIIIYYQC